MEKQAIVFAFYKRNELIGYRLDTFGTIGLKGPKIYTYSESQVDTVIQNINSNVKDDWKVGEILGLPVLAEREAQIHKLLQDKQAFEVRVLKCPNKIYEREFDIAKAEWVTSVWGEYPYEAMEKWLQTPENHEIIETHYFTMEGKLNLQ